MNKQNIAQILDAAYIKFNRTDFIETDPVSVPHRFHQKQDIEIAAFFAATFAWGQRTTIINKCNELIKLMDEAPSDFIQNHKPSDLKRFTHFKHRTFNPTDTLYFIHFLRHHYQRHNSLEEAFLLVGTDSAQQMLTSFHNYFFSLPDSPSRTRKHVATPARRSSCKRLNMLLRWMVRQDTQGVDFGIWKRISPAQLMCPLDVHVERIARKLGLLSRKQQDWQAVEELTANLRKFDSNDPVKYDFALFGLGVLNQKELRTNLK